MTKTLIVCGPTCSGKTTLAKKLEEEYGYSRIVTYTTREPRDGEVTSVDYNFITENMFLTLAMEGFFAEFTNVGGHYYGSAKESYISKNSPDGKSVIVLDPQGVVQVIDEFKYHMDLDANSTKPFVVWLDIPQDVIMSRAINRGDDIIDLTKRIQQDIKDFVPMRLGNFFDVRITHDYPLDKLAKYIDEVFTHNKFIDQIIV